MTMDRGRADTTWTDAEDASADSNPNLLSLAFSAPVISGQGVAGPTLAVQAACLACRQKHLKCDGQRPCARCVANGALDECLFVPSRRGYKGPRRVPVPGNPNKRRAESASPPPPPSSSSSFSSGANLPVMLPASPESLLAHHDAYPVFFGHATLSGSMPAMSFMTPSSCSAPPYMTAPGLANPIVQGLGMFHGAGVDSSSLLSSTSSTSPADTSLVPMAPLSQPRIMPSPAERCLDSFYHHFFASHPFVMPREYFLTFVKGLGRGNNDSSGSGGGSGGSNSSSGGGSSNTNDDNGSGSGSGNSRTVDAVLAAMRYLGSLYMQETLPGAVGKSFLDEAMRICYEPRGSAPKDGFLVQALLLTLVGLDGSGEQERARNILADCQRIALEIGLNTRAFATAHGHGQAVMEESWRRTWWDLYVCDGMIAGVHRMTNFPLFDVAADVGLPCEEAQYTAGQIPPPTYMHDFDDQMFMGDGWEFSSFAYRVAAARNLGRIMRSNNLAFSEGDENLARMNALLTNWKMHLPPSKQHQLDKNGQVDEMLFQGSFMTHACTILLHQPLSQLDSSPAKTVTSCAPHRPVFSGSHFNTHTRHTLAAAQALSNMITQATRVDRHTPFFTCAVSLSSIVHLSRWAAYYPMPGHPDDGGGGGSGSGSGSGGSGMAYGLPTPCTPLTQQSLSAANMLVMQSASDQQQCLNGGGGGGRAVPSTTNTAGSSNNNSSNGNNNKTTNMHDQSSLDSTDDDLRQMIRLNVGALQRISAVWGGAALVCGQVKGVAQEVYRAKKALQEASPVFWTGLTEAEIMGAIREDDGIMAEFDRLVGGGEQAA